MVPVVFSAILVVDTEVKDMHDSHDVSLVSGETCHGEGFARTFGAPLQLTRSRNPRRPRGLGATPGSRGRIFMARRGHSACVS